MSRPLEKTKVIHVRLSEEEFKTFLKLRDESGVPVSVMVRNSITFYQTYYSTHKKAPKA